MQRETQTDHGLSPLTTSPSGRARAAVLVFVAALLLLVQGSCDSDSEVAPGQTGTTTSTSGGGGSGGAGGALPARAAKTLILDGELRHHSSWIDVIDAFAKAGAEASYRRFYPHVTAADVDLAADAYPHAIVVLAAGRSPGTPSSLSRFDEIAIAKNFVQQGGALLLVPQHGWRDSPSGQNDFFIQNRLLEELDVPVRIDRNTVLGVAWTGNPSPPHEPEDWGYPTPLEFMLGYPYLLTPEDKPIAGSSSPTLRVASLEVQVLLRTHAKGYLWKAQNPPSSVASLHEERAVAALARAGDGYVAVVPRGVLLLSAATGNISDKPAMDLASRDAGRAWVESLTATLYDLVRGQASFEVTKQRDVDQLFGVAAANQPALPTAAEVVTIKGDVSTKAVPDEPPSGELTEKMPQPPGQPRALPSWFSPGGGRLAYGGLAPQQADMAVAFGEIVDHGIDVLMTSTDPSKLATLDGQALTDEKAKYAAIAAMAKSAGARWIVGDWFNSAAGDYPQMVGAHGYATDIPAPLHEAYWTNEIIPIYKAVGELAATTPGLAGLHIDLELYNGPVWHLDGWAFSDDTLEIYLKGVSDETFANSLRDADHGDRLDLLVDAGRLGDYFSALEKAAFDLGVRCRKAARDAAPDLELMIYTPGFPSTWFYHGLLRGLGTHEKPVIVLSYEGWSDRATEALYADGVEMVHLGGTIVGHWKPSDFDDVLVALANGNDGYWYFTFNDFSATNPSPPKQHGSSAEYWNAVDAANAQLK